MTADKKPRFFYGYIIVLFSLLVLIVTDGTYYSFGVFFKPLSADFGWTRAMTSAAFSLSGILTGFFYVVTGRLNDKVGPRIVVTACALLLGLGYLLMSQIETLWQFYLYYGLIVAIGVSGGWVPMISTVSRWFVKRRGLMTGIVVTGVGLGTMIGPPVATWLIATYDWRLSYIMVGTASLVILVLAAQFLRRDPSQVGQLPYGEEETDSQDPNLEVSGFSFREAIHTRQFWILLVANLCFGFSLFVIMVHIVPHTTDLGVSAAKAANILATIGGIGIIGRIIMGIAGDRIGTKRPFTLSFIFLSVSLAMLLVAKEVWMFYLFAAVFSFAYGGMVTLLAPLVGDLFDLRSHGTILGSAAFAFNIAGAAGSVLAGYIFDVTGSYQLAFIICIILSIVGLIAALLLRPTPGVGQPSR